MNKKFLLIGLGILLLLAIPLTVYIARLQTKPTTKASPNTSLTFSPPSGNVHVGDTVTLPILLNPGTNQVSFLKLVISYNKQLLQRNPDKTLALVIDPKYFPVPLEGPIYDQCNGDLCTMSMAASIGTDTTKIIQGSSGGTGTPIGSVSFTALAPTTNSQATVNFIVGQTQALSLSAADQPSENVLQPPSGASFAIIGSTSPTPSLTDTPVPTSTTTGGGGQTVVTATPVPSIASAPPACTGLTLDNKTPVASFAVSFTVSGNATGTTITKVTFNFGDTTVQDVTVGGGIGSANVNMQVSHTYAAAGTYTATATLTDANSAISNPVTCSQTVTVSGVGSPTPVQSAQTTKGGIPLTGPSQILGIGAVGGVITVLGALLLFGL